ncbi:BTAD domain-containing putative transcriptional regulator [Arsenicicoccus sp. oral taxon 190]|uniref:BTAD domain-containing putative transcriptional regulator n=1 Tax=Arsenicicoccus sp. oral taxon 190 TaxID=1658671 RepID=UPI000679EEF5|nr:BTAD domain-containing putative transcriptional regulator [Arsenicicoccus sp. oral taxon 190]AKT50971.1 hypothetical protein ADJ73_05935 [Arsenicicoccus sp. oral taxon 190]
MLGPLGVELEDGIAVAPRGDRPRALLSVLCVRHGRPVTGDALLEQVWGERGAALTATAVHTVVARLRRGLGADLVRTSPLGYLVPPEVEVDADRFTELALQATEAVAGPGCERLCRDALALWRGRTAYDGVEAEVVLPERVRLDELRRLVRATLATCLLAREGGREARDAAAAEALLTARDLTSDNPLDERAAMIAMRAAHRLGRTGEALLVHEELRRALRTQLGVDPGTAVVDLHARILAQDSALDRPAALPLHPGRRLPVPATPTVGREEELATVLQLLDSGRRLVTITGPGGVGKSRLLADVGAALRPGAEVVHLTLAGYGGRTADDLATDLALAMGVPLGGEDAVTSLVRSLRSAQGIVLLDEAEWVVQPVAELTLAVLAGAPDVQVVVASRIPLQVVGERVLELEPLPTPPPDSPPEVLRASPAIRLLADRLDDRGVTSSSASRSSSLAELRVLAEVAARLDGLPLALELAAAAADITSPAQLVDLVRRPLDLTSTEHGRPDRQASLRRTLTWSVARLDPLERRVLGRLSVFAGPFTLVAARGVAGLDPSQVDAAVRRLATHHLLAVDRSAEVMTFRLLRTIRDLAREELVAPDELADARARHRSWFAGLWRDVPLCDALVEHLGRTHEDHHEALDDALAAGDDVAAADIVTALCRWWLFVEAPTQGLRWTATLLARPGLGHHQRARLQILRGAFAHRLVLAPQDYDALTLALADDPDWTCLLELLLTIDAYAAGDLPLADRHLARGLGTATDRAPHHLPELVATRAVLDAAAGRAEAAVASAHEAMARVGPTTSAVHHVTVVPKVALALLDADRPAEALDLLHRSVREAVARFGIQPTATVATNAGWAALALGRDEDATGWFRHAMVGPHAFVSAAALGECCVGMAAALARRRPAVAAELLGLGDQLLAQEGAVLPPSLAAHADRARAALDPSRPPSSWTPELAIARAVQLVDDLEAGGPLR